MELSMETLDDRALALCADYAAKGEVAFVVRTLENNDVRYLGCMIDPELLEALTRKIVAMYRDAVTANASETVN